MPQTLHVERHFTGGEFVRDVVIGMSDGLTVPFVLAAGLSGAVASARVVVVAGLAEIAAGSIAMGLGGFLAAKSDAEHYQQELARERKEVETIPEAESSDATPVLRPCGVLSKHSSLERSPQAPPTLSQRGLRSGSTYTDARHGSASIRPLNPNRRHLVLRCGCSRVAIGTGIQVQHPPGILKGRKQLSSSD